MEKKQGRTELSKYTSDYQNSVVMGLLEFLNDKMDSEKTYEWAHEESEHIEHATLDCMSKNDESICFYDRKTGYATSLLLLDNNKLLLFSDSEEDDYLMFTHYFKLFSDASDFTVRVEENDDKTSSIKFYKHGFKLEYPSVDHLNVKLEDNTPIINYLKPVSFDELCERGITDKPKVKSL